MTAASFESGRGFAPRSAGEWACFAIIGSLLASAGAYGTDDIALVWRLFYWVPILLAGGVTMVLLESGLARRRRLFRRTFLRAGALVLVSCLPIALAAWILSSLLFGHELALDDLPQVYFSAGTICAVLLAVLSLLRSTRRDAPPPIAAPSMPAFFAERMDWRLRQATLLAARAEDHYVRLYTTGGEALILARFGDVLGQLAALDGARVHRSWWVARAAISDARWRRGGGALTLTTGLRVPVSRAHAQRLREEGRELTHVVALRPAPHRPGLPPLPPKG